MKTKATKLLLGVIGLFLLLQMEEVCIFVSKLLRPTEGLDAIQCIIAWIPTCIIWGSGTFALLKYFHQRELCCLQTRTVPTKWSIFIVLGSIIWEVVMYEAMNHIGTIKIVPEVTAMYRYLGNRLGSLTFFFQYLYYAFEIVLFLGIMILAQELGETVFHRNWIPYGGIVLGMTWGMNHLLTKDLNTAIDLLLLSIVMGICYLSLRKNIKYMYLLAFILFAIL